jgi:hypothetical protein
MANPFAITAASNSVPLRDDRSGQAVFTVFNASGRPIRGRARIVAEDPIAEQWLSLVGDAERVFGIAGTQQFMVQIEAPSTAPAGDMRFRLDMVDVENPDENYSRGPTVTFQVPEPVAAPKPFPWWIVAVAVGVILLIGAAIILPGIIDGGTVTPTPVLKEEEGTIETATPTPIRIEDIIIGVVTATPTPIPDIIIITPGPGIPITPGPIVPVPPAGTIAP